LDKQSTENIQIDDPKGLVDRLRSREATDQDIENVVKLVSAFGMIRTLLQQRKFKLLSLLRKIFGLKTESFESKPKPDPKPDAEKKRKGGKGRNGRNDYPGAESIEIKHETLKSEDTCPECKDGQLTDGESAVEYVWTGQAPLKLEILLLQRLICPTCKATFTASIPEHYRIKTVDDSGCERKCGQCDASASANATVAQMRYQNGVPNHRLAQIQDAAGTPLPASSQSRMVDQVDASAQLIMPALEAAAANSFLVGADDTAMGIQSNKTAQRKKAQLREEAEVAGEKIKSDKKKQGGIESKAEPAENSDKNTGKKTQTTVILADFGHRAVLVITGHNQAGSNVKSLLEKRIIKTLPIYICDGLFANKFDDIKVLQAYCLDHARRHFFDLLKSHRLQAEHVLRELKKVYGNDAKCKESKCSPEERLEYHQKESGPIFTALKIWMQAELDSKTTEPNGTLAGAILYWMKRWEGLTLFLTVAGAPLANIDVERQIKAIIRQRKNSLQYKNYEGAARGDRIQSLIFTCIANGQNPHDYLTAIQEYRSKVKDNPELWLPWNYKQQLPIQSS
jgi:transposase